jgi:hypothetical protein
MGALRSAIEEVTSTDPAWMSEVELTNEIVEVSRAVDILSHRISALTEEFGRRDGHKAEGFRSASRWLAVTTDIDNATAKRITNLGRVLDRHDATSRMAAEGELSRSRLRILARAAAKHPEQYREHESMLLEHARELSLRDFRRAVDYWSNCADATAAEDEAFDQAERAYLHASVTFGGMVKVDAMLDKEAGEVFLTALDAAMTPEARRDGASGMLRPASRRRADALTEISRQFLASYPGVVGGSCPQVSLIVDLDTLMGRDGKRCELPHTGTITPETARRILCDAGVSRFIVKGDSVPLDMGRLVRTATPAQRLAVILRDGGCTHPGCDAPPEWCDLHHIVHWLDGGRTDLDNLTLLCRRHHLAAHADDDHRKGWKRSTRSAILPRAERVSATSQPIDRYRGARDDVCEGDP